MVSVRCCVLTAVKSVCICTHLRLRNSPTVPDHRPVPALLAPLGRLSSSSHCTWLSVSESTDVRLTPSYASQVDGCFPLISMVSTAMTTRGKCEVEKMQVSREKRKKTMMLQNSFLPTLQGVAEATETDAWLSSG